MQNGAGMDKILPGIERFRLADGAEIFFGILVRDAKRVNSEAGADCERRLSGPRALGGWDRSLAEGGRWCDRFRGQHSAAGDAEHAMALDPQIEPRRSPGGGHD